MIPVHFQVNGFILVHIQEKIHNLSRHWEKKRKKKYTKIKKITPLSKEKKEKEKEKKKRKNWPRLNILYMYTKETDTYLVGFVICGTIPNDRDDSGR